MAITVRPLSDALGAEVSGVDLREPIGDELADELRAAFDRYHLLLFRGQDLDAEAQIRAVGCFGPVVDELGDDRAYTHFSNDEATLVPGFRFRFHQDYVFTPEPVPVLSLYAVDVDEGSVPTEFVSCASGAQRLSDAMRARLDGLQAVHASNHTPSSAEILETQGSTRVNLLEQPDAPIGDYPRSTHPVLKVHPRTGESLLYVSEYFTSHIDGLDAAESEALLEELWATLYAPEHRFVHHWCIGDLAVWDNLALQHARGDTRTGSPRTLRRVMASPRPVNDLLAAAGLTGKTLAQKYGLAG
jgi:taurine dioxygenase